MKGSVRGTNPLKEMFAFWQSKGAQELTSSVLNKNLKFV